MRAILVSSRHVSIVTVNLTPVTNRTHIFRAAALRLAGTEQRSTRPVLRWFAASVAVLTSSALGRRTIGGRLGLRDRTAVGDLILL